MKKCLILLALGMASVASAQDIKRSFCVGEKDTECAVKPVYSCPQDSKVGANDHAKSLCTIFTEKGPKVLDFMIDVKSTVGGNRCGYTVYEVTCFRK